MKYPALAGLLASASIPARAEMVDGNLICIIDDDTVELAGERIRLVEPDGSEFSKPRRNTELAKGLRASGRLRQLLEGPVRIERTERYLRTLASVVAPEGKVADILIREGLAIPYKPGFEAYQQCAEHWCPGQGRGPTSPVQGGERFQLKAIGLAVTPACRPLAARLASPAGRASVTENTPVRRPAHPIANSSS